ncbi:MAG: Hsp20/alpha crystallin family protein [Rhodospirillales bacterium]
MTGQQQLQVQKKREVEKTEEATIPARFYVPNTDIFEDESALTVVMEMPGVQKENVEIKIEKNVLAVEGRIDFSKYETLDPVYTEYNVGPYKRSFSLSSKIDQEKISAEMNDGLLTLVLPKAEDTKPRTIKIG